MKTSPQIIAEIHKAKEDAANNLPTILDKLPVSVALNLIDMADDIETLRNSLMIALIDAEEMQGRCFHAVSPDRFPPDPKQCYQCQLRDVLQLREYQQMPREVKEP